MENVTATIELPEGYTLIGDATHTFTENGTHTFTYQSVHGTQYTHTITVDWIDKVAPTATITYSNENKTNQSVNATLNVKRKISRLKIITVKHLMNLLKMVNSHSLFVIKQEIGLK